jgi:peptidoglycan hydrolase-like protein with peptidoglycan-binding domain
MPVFERSLYLQTVRMKGDDVLLLQQRLLELGYSEVGVPDGVFGPMTDEAVRHFQENNGLVIDGIVGPVTWEVLFSGDAKGP